LAVRDGTGLVEGRRLVPIDRIGTGQLAAPGWPVSGRPLHDLDQASDVVLTGGDLRLRQPWQREALRIEG
jgi:hypothetical protein